MLQFEFYFTIALSMSQAKTVILAFVRTAEEEVKVKQLAGRAAGLRAQHTVVSQLNQRLKRTIANTDLPVIWLSGEQQLGSNFGERITHAIKYAFDQGYENVMVVGNDCPRLTTSLLKKADAALQNSKLVVGKTPEGGAYLIGIHRSVFDPIAFKNLPWQTARLSDALSKSENFRILESNLIVSDQFPVLSDVNNYQQFRLLIEALPVDHPFCKLVKGFKRSFLYIHSFLFHIDLPHLLAAGLRAPPLV